MNVYGLFGLLIILCAGFAIRFIFRKKGWNTQWVDKLNQPKILYGTLIILILVGFLFKLDYNLQWGCVVTHEDIFSNQNILYTGIALFLLSAGYFFHQKTIRATLLSVELIIWLYKLFIIKGGYVIGIVGVPDSVIMLFDLFELTSFAPKSN